MTVAEREELKRLSLEVLGGEHLWRKMLKGVQNQLKTPDGKDAFMPKSKVPMLHVVRRTEQDILKDLRLLKKRKDEKIEKAIKEAEAGSLKVSDGVSANGQPEVP